MAPLGGSGIKQRGGGVATVHHCILGCLTRLVFEELRSDACVEHDACSCCDCDYALYRICTSTAPYVSHQTCIRSGIASARPWPRTKDANRMSMASRTLRTDTKKGAVYELGHPWIHAKILSLDRRRISLQDNTPLPFSRCGRIPQKNQKWSRSWPCKATTDDERCTKFSSVHEHGYTWIHWISPTMDKGRIVLHEKVAENALLATLFEEQAQEKTGSWWRPPTRACPKEQEKFHQLIGPLNLVLQVFLRNGLVNSYLNRNWNCIARNFRQRKLSSKATVRQFVGNLFSSNVGRRLFLFGRSVVALLLIVYHHIREHFWSNTCSFAKKFSQKFNLVKKLLWQKRRN